VSETDLERCPHTAIDRFLPTVEPFRWRENRSRELIVAKFDVLLVHEQYSFSFADTSRRMAFGRPFAFCRDSTRRPTAGRILGRPFVLGHDSTRRPTAGGILGRPFLLGHVSTHRPMETSLAYFCVWSTIARSTEPIIIQFIFKLKFYIVQFCHRCCDH
jgi:hypothetical protein